MSPLVYRLLLFFVQQPSKLELQLRLISNLTTLGGFPTSLPPLSFLADWSAKSASQLFATLLEITPDTLNGASSIVALKLLTVHPARSSKLTNDRDEKLARDFHGIVNLKTNKPTTERM
uniref:Uncharacterized protein n=1 Tax=Mycena chlorophos TaxID=658473 RepID=A0ABQ0LX10_MYCCL|nr:predicted protein [Mycena chlorophos]